MIDNVLQIPDVTEDLDYKDLSDIPEWALQSVKNLSAYEIVQGNDQNEFKPNRILSKAEAIELGLFQSCCTDRFVFFRRLSDPKIRSDYDYPGNVCLFRKSHLRVCAAFDAALCQAEVDPA